MNEGGNGGDGRGSGRGGGAGRSGMPPVSRSLLARALPEPLREVRRRVQDARATRTCNSHGGGCTHMGGLQKAWRARVVASDWACALMAPTNGPQRQLLFASPARRERHTRTGRRPHFHTPWLVSCGFRVEARTFLNFTVNLTFDSRTSSTVERGTH